FCSALAEKLSNDVVKDVSILDDGNTKGSASEMPGENKDDTKTDNKKTNGSEPFTTEEIDDTLYLKINDKNLLATLQSFVRSEDLYAVIPKISAHELFMILPQLRNYVGNDPTTDQMSGSNVPLDNPNNPPLKKLVNWLEEAFDTTLKQIDNMINKFMNSVRSWHISHFIGVLSIDQLPVVPLKEECEMRDELVKRGKNFEKYALGAHYLRYSGKFFRQSWCGNTYYKGDGRIMIDTATFCLIDPNYNMGFNSVNYMHTHITNRNAIPKLSVEGAKKKVKEEELYIFYAKKWGQFYVDQVDEIKFDDDAFDNLIMDTNKKDIITCLVKSELSGGLDLISGKVGKTLTTEAISEYLRRPLYAVSVGELGVTPKELEAKLSEILEVASVWDAVILIDEAQIWRTFLDRADGKDKSQVDIEKLKQRQLNGREIKTTVRMAKALATKTDPGAVITTSHLENILDITLREF
ncbi:11208_t:CDS:10, partial [Racocetra fulgida]